MILTRLSRLEYSLVLRILALIGNVTIKYFGTSVEMALASGS